MGRNNVKPIDDSSKKKNYNPDGVDADMWDIERKIPVLSDFNTTKGVYEKSVFTGINNEQSIFDKTAIFHTKRE